MKLNDKKNILLLLLLIILLPAKPCLAQADNGPLDQLKTSIDKVLVLLRNKDTFAKWLERRREIVSIVRERVDDHEFSMRVLATHWKKRNDQEKEEFVSLFTQVLETSYINKLKLYSDESVIFDKQIVKGDRAVVYSDIIHNQQEIPVTYRLKKENDDWLIYDIIIEGVSLVQNYRKQFSQIINSEGYEGLVLRMKEKILENSKKDLEENAS